MLPQILTRCILNGFGSSFIHLVFDFDEDFYKIILKYQSWMTRDELLEVIIKSLYHNQWVRESLEYLRQLSKVRIDFYALGNSVWQQLSAIYPWKFAELLSSRYSIRPRPFCHVRTYIQFHSSSCDLYFFKSRLIFSLYCFLPLLR